MIPEISVVMPVYNRESMVGEAIGSILAQTYADFEFIIIDDCSTDGTCRVIESFQDDRIRFIRNESKKNIPKLRNQGMDLARGKYIAIMDSDDASLPHRLAVQKRFLDENEDYGLVGTFVRQNEDEIRAYPQGNDLLKYYTAFKCCFCNPSVMLRRSVFDENHIRHDESCTIASDYSLQVSALPYTKIENLSEPCLMYRFHKDNITNRTLHDPERALMRVEIIDRIHERALKNLGIELSESETATFLAFTGESVKKLPEKERFEDFKALLDKMERLYSGRFGAENVKYVHEQMIERTVRRYGRSENR